ncbi:ABC transporter substrate-binding protein [Kineosporia sp. J2-2]|uniref:ABC transporter substrate-binding protein n=1 Tax=Kineosporia corallincola TaxID=2835133 RepID=A0ABS5TQS9_9ACTN|nr:ABC transporter substrate-binding protein [Kineosporia corallincola]MBT0772751.1 ABC transporter substrate-binding protein [Kineosporia corallincola]
MNRKPAGRAVVVTVLLTTALAACGKSESAGSVQVAGGGVTTVRWIYDWTPTSADLPVLKGLAEGWFEEAGVKVATTPGGAIDQLESVGAGNHDMTVGGGVELLVDQARGLPVKSVGLVQPVALGGLVCNPDSGVKDGVPKTLLDRKLATASSDADDVVWQIWRDRNQLTGKVTEVSAEAGPDLLYQGVVDCFPDFLTLAPLEAEKEFGEAPVLVPYSKELGVIGQVLDVNTDFAQKNPQAVRAFVDVYARGMEWAASHQADAVKLMKKTYPDIDEKITAQELKSLAGYWAGGFQRKNGYLSMNDHSWAATVDVLLKGRAIDEAPEMSSVYTTEYLPSTPYLP